MDKNDVEGGRHSVDGGKRRRFFSFYDISPTCNSTAHGLNKKNKANRLAYVSDFIWNPCIAYKEFWPVRCRLHANREIA